MALDNYLMHATMFNIFAADALNSLQNKKWCTCNVHQLRILVYFRKQHWLQHTSQFKMLIYAIRYAAMHCFNFITCLTSLFLFFHINTIHLVNASTEQYITNVIRVIKASWRHGLTNQLSLYVQHPAISGPRDF